MSDVAISVAFIYPLSKFYKNTIFFIGDVLDACRFTKKEGAAQ